MTRTALNGLWNFIQSMALTDRNKQWLADRLIESKSNSLKEAQEQYVRESLTRAMHEVKSARACGRELPNARNLFNELGD